MDPASPRAGGPSPRRSHTAAQKLAHVQAYELACQTRGGGAYLRANGLYSSQMTEWRKLRDAGVLQADPGRKAVAKLSREQAEIARLKRELDTATTKLARTEVALEIMGKAHALLESLSESAQPQSNTTRRNKF